MSMRRWEKLLDILYPPKCAFCGRLLEDSAVRICDGCVSSLPYTDGKCADARFVSRVRAPLYYENDVRQALLRFKFHSSPYLAETFGGMIAEEVRRDPPMDFDILSWIPLSRRRKRKRGYDQAELLCRAAGKKLGYPAISTLRKKRDVPAQSGLNSAEERRANISGCYEAIDPNAIRGKRILLIDDIVTTGSTLSEAAKMLLLAGAEEVFASTVATRR